MPRPIGSKDDPIADKMITVRIPHDVLIWLKIKAAKDQKTLTGVLQSIIEDWRTDYEGKV